jgi:hypothetical protein
MPKSDIRFLLRIPLDLSERLLAETKETGESLNSLICRKLNAAPNDRPDHANNGRKIATRDAQADPVHVVETPVSAEVCDESNVSGHGETSRDAVRPKRLTGEAFMALPYSEQLRARREGRAPF